MAARKTPPPATTASTAATPFWDSSSAAYEQLVPLPNWSPWDTAMLAGMVVPGLVRVGTRKRRRLVQQAAVGSQAVEMVDVGVEPVLVEFHCTMWTPEHLQQFAQLAATIEIRPNQKPQAMAVVHPGLAMLNISGLYITSIGAPTPSSPGGVLTAIIEAQNFTVPKKAKNSTANGVLPIDSAKVKKPGNAIRDGMGGTAAGAPSQVPEFLKPNP